MAYFVLRVLYRSGEGINKFEGFLAAFPKSDVFQYCEKFSVSLTKDIGQFVTMRYGALVYRRMEHE